MGSIASMDRLKSAAAQTRENPFYFEFLKFGMVGTFGFAVDTGLLHTALLWGWGLYWGRAFSFLCGATTCWALNRRFTFRYNGPARRHHQWAKFISVATIGGSVNFSVYALLVYMSSYFAAYPILGIAAGSLAGMTLNYMLSRQMVFGDRSYGQ